MYSTAQNDSASYWQTLITDTNADFHAVVTSRINISQIILTQQQKKVAIIINTFVLRTTGKTELATQDQDLQMYTMH
jgi:hypothetical protein